MSDLSLNKIFGYFFNTQTVEDFEQDSGAEISAFGDDYSSADEYSSDSFSYSSLSSREGVSEEIAGFMDVLSELPQEDCQYIMDLLDKYVVQSEYGVYIVNTDARHLKTDSGGRETFDIYTLVSAQDMENAKASGKYGNLDEKMIAFLIVAEKTFDYINNEPEKFDKAILPSLQTVAKSGLAGLNSENIVQFFNDLFIGRAKIDEKIGDFSQGQQGDCWLLAGLKSLSFTPKGEAIIKDAIKLNPDGSYSVDFKGAGTEITITEKELKEAMALEQYVKGDADVLLLELATEKVLKMIAEGEIKAPDDLVNSSQTGLTSGQFKHFIYLLTGEDCETVYNYNNTEIYDQRQRPRGFSLDDEFFDKMEQEPENYAAVVALLGKKLPDGSHGKIIIKDIDGNEITLCDEQHGCSIKSVNGDTVTIVNPWHADEEIIVSKSELEQYISYIQYYRFD